MDEATVKDIDTALAGYRRDANKATALLVLIAFGIGGAVAFCLWMWTNVTLDVVATEAAHWTASYLYGLLAALGVFGLAGFPEHGDYQLPDEALQRLAALDIRDKQGFQILQEKLRQLGYITLGDVEDFALGERKERCRQQALEQPGAKALLG